MQPPPAPTVHAPAPSAATGRGRIAGIDLARALAIIGMVSVHVAPPLAGTGGWYALPYGRSSTLFALVAGLGIALGSRRGTTASARARLLWRAAWLAPVGLALQALGTPVAIILHYYALWFVLAAVVVRWPTQVLLPVTAVGFVAGPLVLVWAQVTHPAWYAPGRGVWFGEVGDVLLTGYYPTVSWVWLVFLGMLLARLDLRSSRVAASLAAVGATVAAATYLGAAALRDTLDLRRWAPLLDTQGHADGPVEQLAATGVAVAVVAVCVLLARLAPRAVAPGVALGRFALTVYVGHLLVYGLFRELLYSRTPVEGLLATLGVTVVSTLVAVAWLAVLPRGPLEALDRAGDRWLAQPLAARLSPRPAAVPPPPTGHV